MLFNLASEAMDRLLLKENIEYLPVIDSVQAQRKGRSRNIRIRSMTRYSEIRVNLDDRIP